MLRAYTIGQYFLQVIFFVGSFFNKKLAMGYAGRKKLPCFFTKIKITAGKKIWVHAASLGEYLQILPVLEKIIQEQPNTTIILSFFSPSGYEKVSKNPPKNVQVCYMPLDIPSKINTFLDATQIEIAIFVKYEFWFNTLKILKDRRIPTYLVAGVFQPKQLFFKPIVGKYFSQFLHSFTYIFVQYEKDAQYLKQLGNFPHSIDGDPRFDQVLNNVAHAVNMPKIQDFKGVFPLLVLGSSWIAEENILLNYLQNHVNNYKIIIAPHDIARSGEICKRFAPYGATLYSKDHFQDAPILILDTLGLLAQVYQYSDISFIGGGFTNALHNILEPAAWGNVVLMGNHTPKFSEAEALQKSGGAFAMAGQHDFNTLLAILHENVALRKNHQEKARQFVQNQAGASEKISKALFKQETI